MLRQNLLARKPLILVWAFTLFISMGIPLLVYTQKAKADASYTWITPKSINTTVLQTGGTTAFNLTFTGMVASDAIPDCGGGVLNWIVCSVIDAAESAAKQVDHLITNTLNIDFKGIFDNTDQKGPSQGYYAAWNSFRIIATALIIIAGLVMVASQAIGLEILDAYTIRKTLPRLLIAIIGISLSWPLMRFVVSFFDTLGFDIRQLIYSPFSRLGGHINVQVGIASFLTVGGLALTMGFASLTLILSALLAILVGFVILVVRQLAIIVLVILAPVAIACYILPNTQKVWKLWSDNFFGLMLMFPIISAFIAAGHVFAAVSIAPGTGNSSSDVAQIIGLVAYFAPYFLLPLAFRLATGAVGALAGMVNDRGRGAFDRLKNIRGNATAKNLHDMKTGNRFKGDSFASKAFNASSRNVANLPNAGVVPWKMRSRMQSARATASSSEMAEYMEKNAAFNSIKGNDDYLQATMKSMGGGDSESEWRKYLSDPARGYSGRALEQGIAQIRAAKRGVSSDTFNKAAVMANAATGTGWKEGGAGAMMASINEAAGDDRHTAATMLAQMRGMAGQSGRMDLAGSGFGTQVGAMEDMYKANPATGRKITADEANERVIESALFTKGPGEYARARGQAVANMAPQMLKHLQKSHQKLETARASGNAQEIMKSERALAQDYAALDNLHDNLNHMAPENARIIADTVLSQRISSDGPTVMDQIKSLQTSSGAMGQAYQDTRKSYDRQQYAAEQGKPPEPPES